MTKKNLPIEQLKKEDLSNIKMIIFDVDGVLVPRGTKIKQNGEMIEFNIKKIPSELIDQIKKLYQLGFHINISSGRGLYMLQNMFRDILPYVSLTFENGSATWHKGKIIQHINSFEQLAELNSKLTEIKHKNIKGFEPKELIITIHCHDRVEEIENTSKKYDQLYCLWNGEAYDFGIKETQTKGEGIKQLRAHLGFDKDNTLAIGDNYNDIELLNEAGLAISADKTRLEGDYCVPLNEDKLPAHYLMEQILKVMNHIE